MSQTSGEQIVLRFQFWIRSKAVFAWRTRRQLKTMIISQPINGIKNSSATTPSGRCRAGGGTELPTTVKHQNTVDCRQDAFATSALPAYILSSSPSTNVKMMLTRINISTLCAAHDPGNRHNFLVLSEPVHFCLNFAQSLVFKAAN